MAHLILFNKPFKVLSQFTSSENKKTLADYIDYPKVYPAGRLDYDSEGLLLLTNDGSLQNTIANPKYKLPKTYWVQVEGEVSGQAIDQLSTGLALKDGMTKPAIAKPIEQPEIWPRSPPIRFRKNDVTSWLELTIKEGRNRQVRRMTAALGLPTLRLIRYSIGDWTINDLEQGKYNIMTVGTAIEKGAGKSSNKGAMKHPSRRTKKFKRI